MRIRVGCEFQYDATWPAPAVLLVKARDDDPHRILHEAWTPAPDLPTHDYYDLYRNRCQRLTLPIGPSALTYDAVVEISGEPDEVDTSAIQHPVEELPDDVDHLHIAEPLLPLGRALEHGVGTLRRLGDGLGTRAGGLRLDQ